MAFLMLLRRLHRTEITAHGFRSSFRDWAAEKTNAPRGVFLSNNAVLRIPSTLSWPLHMPHTYSDRQRDHLFLYRRTQ